MPQVLKESYYKSICLGGHVKEIQLTKGLVALVDDEDFEHLNQWKWGVLNNHGLTYYAVRTPRIGSRGPDGRKKKVTIYMHRLLLDAKPGQFVDHIGHNGLDNRKSNLRLVSKRENGRNALKTRKPKSSMFKGVDWVVGKNKWRASISMDRKTKFLGYFGSELEAAKAYDLAASQRDSAHACVNFSTAAQTAA